LCQTLKFGFFRLLLLTDDFVHQNTVIHVIQALALLE